MYDPNKVLNYFDKMDRRDRKLSEVVSDIAEALGAEKRLVEKTIILEREDDVILLREETATAGPSGGDAAPENVLDPEKLGESISSMEYRKTYKVGDRVRVEHQWRPDEEPAITGTIVKMTDNDLWVKDDDTGKVRGPFGSLSWSPEKLEESELLQNNFVVYGPSVKSIEERLAHRKMRNQLLREATEKGEEVEPYKVRYKLQDWANGGQEYDPEKNEVKFTDAGGPSEYERWRREKIDSRRKNRLDAEKKDDERNRSVYTSTYERNMDRRNMLDGQVDDFLAEYIEKYGDGAKTPAKPVGKPTTPTEALKESRVREGYEHDILGAMDPDYFGSDDDLCCEKCGVPVESEDDLIYNEEKGEMICNDCWAVYENGNRPLIESKKLKESQAEKLAYAVIDELHLEDDEQIIVELFEEYFPLGAAKMISKTCDVPYKDVEKIVARVMDFDPDDLTEETYDLEFDIRDE